MNKDYSDLRNKTILDFCKNKTILTEILPYVPSGFDKQRFYKTYYKDNPDRNGMALLEYAEMTNNGELKKAVESQFKEDFEKFFNE